MCGRVKVVGGASFALRGARFGTVQAQFFKSSNWKVERNIVKKISSCEEARQNCKRRDFVPILLGTNPKEERRRRPGEG